MIIHFTFYRPSYNSNFKFIVSCTHIIKKLTFNICFFLRHFRIITLVFLFWTMRSNISSAISFIFTVRELFITSNSFFGSSNTDSFIRIFFIFILTLIINCILRNGYFLKKDTCI